MPKGITAKISDDDREWRKLVARMDGMRTAHVAVGLHSDAKPYERGQEEPANVAQIASFHEFGTDTIPARPFIGPTVDGKRDEYGRLMERVARLIVVGKLTPKRALALVGEQMSADIKAAIRALTDPPLAESTIAAKKRKAAYLGAEKAEAYAAGGANPLIDTGHMLNSVTYAVVIGGAVVEHPVELAEGKTPTIPGGGAE